jgi:DNA-binding HxlR family transcriptional regulator
MQAGIVDLQDFLKVVARRYTLEILKAARDSSRGLRHKDFSMVVTPMTRSQTLQALVEVDLLSKKRGIYSLTQKGREALPLLVALRELALK